MERSLKPAVRGTLLAAVVCGLAAPATSAQSWADFSGSRARTDQDHVDVRVRYGAGILDLRGNDGADLYRFGIRYDQTVFEPVHTFDDGRLTLGVRRADGEGSIKTRSGGRLNLLLSTEVEIQLDIEFGAVQANVDLGGLQLSELNLRTGASESNIEVSRPNPVELGTARIEAGAAEFTATQLGNLHARNIHVDTGVGDVSLDFGGTWQRSAEVDLNVGLGTVELRFPRELGVRLTRSGFLASVDVDGLTKRGESYYSPNWDSADYQVTVDVTAAFGSVRVEWGN